MVIEVNPINRCRPLGRIGLVLFAMLVVLGASGCGRGGGNDGDVFPRKPIKVVVPFPAGGGSDRFVRIIQKAVRDHGLLPQPLVVINVPGAGGTVGSRRVRDAVADGYTILCLHEGILSSKYAGRVPYGPEVFRPIASTGQSNLVLCVREDSTFEDLSGLMGIVREQPDYIRFGMAQGSPTHFAGRRLEAASDASGRARFRYVASGGGAKRFNDLIGGHVDVTPFSLAEYASFEASGVRAIAYLGRERLPEMPDIPTASEAGYDVVMPHVQYWWAPKATSDAAVGRIADVLEAAMKTSDVEEKLDEMKIRPLFLRGQAMAAHLASRETEFQNVALVQFDGLIPDVLPVVLALAFLLGSLAAYQWAKEKRSISSSGAIGGPFALGLATLALYVLGMQVVRLPYALATAVFVPLMGFVVGARSRGSMVCLLGVGVALGWACFLIFTKVLVIDLP